MHFRKPLTTNHLDFNELTQSLGIRAKDFKDGFIIESHVHQSHQLLYATKGVMRLQTEHKVWTVPSDRAVYIPAGTVHCVSMFGDVSMRTLYIDPGRSSLDRIELRVVQVTPLMRELICALGEEPVVYPPASRGEKIAQLIELELELERAQDEPFSIPLPVDPRLQTLCASLLANPAQRKTLDDWSVICGASVRTLSRLFEKDMGMSFRRWRQLIRFHRAIEALSQGKSIAQVAYQNGYKSPSAFSAAFHASMGQSPSALAKNKSEVGSRKSEVGSRKSEVGRIKN